MTTKLTKYGIMIIAAVLLMTVAFAGAASAEDIAPTGPQATTIIKANDDGTYSSGYAVSNAYLIENESNWRYVVNHTELWDDTLVLTNDITFTEPVKSIGDSSSKFNGTIYGNGKKFVNFTQSDSNAHGLIYYATEGCVLNNVHLYDSYISSSGYRVGGLVGHASSASTNGVRLCGCSVEYSNVTSSSHCVGGLVGYADSAKIWVNASRVDHAYVKSSSSANVGGLVGRAGSASTVYINNSLVNCSEIYASSSVVGGLVGCANSASYLTNTSVRDCKIWSSSSYVGGLVGFADSASTMNGCAVENCTVMSPSSGCVGGLVGGAISASTFTGAQSWVKYTWVNATGVNNGSIMGLGSAIVTTAPLHTGVYSSTSGYSTISGIDNSFDGTSPSIAIGSIIVRKNLQPGVHYGYCSVTLSVDVDGSIAYGSLSASPSSGSMGTEITVTVKNDPGYHKNWTYYGPTVGSTAKFTIDGTTFSLPAYDVKVSGDFLANETNLTFYNETEDATFYQTLDVKYATSVPSLTFAMPEKSGYVFAGWKTVDDKVLFNATGSPKNATAYYITESGIWDYKGANGTTLKLVGIWGSDKTVITLNRTGGDGADQQVNVTNGAASTDPQADTPTKTGFTFNGWYNETGGLGTMVINAEGHLVSGVTNYTDAGGNWTNTSSAITLYANWTETNTEVSFATNGGSGSVDAKTFEYGQDLSSTTVGYTGSLAGYHFGGWNSSLLTSVQVFNDTGKVVNDTAYVTADRKWNYSESALQLNAFWIENVTKLEFKNSSVLVCATTATYKQQVVPPVFTAPTRVGYTLKGWNVSDNPVILFNATGVPQKGISPYIDGDGNWKYDGAEETIELNAVWEKSSTVITLQKTGEWETANTVTVQNGTSALLPSMPANPVRDGYTFNGWKNESGADGVNIIGTNSALVSGVDGYTDGSGNWINSSATVTLYGNWSANVTNLEFFNTTDDSSYFCATTVTYDKVVNPVAYPAKDGYTFDGWYDGTYQLFNETGYAFPNVDGYISYGNWSKVGANDATLNLYGKWTAKEILINLNAEGGVADTTAVNVTFNTSTLSKDIIRPTKTGFTFNGWFNETGGLGEMIINETGKLVNTVAGYTDGGKWINATSPITLYANWTSSVTNVTFNPGDGSTGSTTKLDIPYGKVVSIAVPSEGTKAGYHFGGWNTSTDHVQLFNETGAAVNGTEPYITNDGKWNSTESYLTLEGIWYQNVTRLNLTYNGVSKVVTATFKEKNLKNNDITAPTKTGYTFNGWFTAGEGGQKILVQNGGDVKLNSVSVTDYIDSNGQWINQSANGTEIMLYAQWTANVSSFKLWSDSLYSDTASATYGCATISQGDGNPLIPTSSTYTVGKTFRGWYNKSSGGVKVINESGLLEHGVSGYTTIDGKWNTSVSPVSLWMNISENITNLDFYNETGTVFWSSSVTYNKNVGSAEVPTKDHFTFNGWSIEGTAIKLWDENGNVISPVDCYIDNKKWINDTLKDGDTLNLSAVWALNTTTISLNGNGGSPDSTVTATYNKSTFDGTITIPSRAGYWFDGWSNKSDGTGAIIITNTSVFAQGVYGYTNNSRQWINDTRAVTLYANWTANVTNVTFVTGTSDTYPGALFTYNEPLSNYPYSSSNPGYHFGGWNYTDTYFQATYTLFNDSGAPQEVAHYINDSGYWKQTWENGTEMTLNADWAANVTKLNLTLDGSSHAIVNATYMGGIDNTHVTHPEKSGYRFLGWFNESDGGVKVLSQTDDTIALVDNVPGYTENNKWINKSVENNGEIQLYGQWKALVTTIYLKVSSTVGGQTYGIYENVTAHYGSPDLGPATLINPTKEGYTFRGWYNDSDASGNGIGTNVINVSYLLNYTDGYYVNESGCWNSTAETLSLYANFTANVTNATFNTLDGTPVVNEYFTYGQQVQTVNVSYKDGYWFTGWNISDADAPGWLNLFNRTATPVVNDRLQHYIQNSNWMNASIYDQQVIEITAHWTANRSILNLDAAPGSGVSPEAVYATYNSTELNSSITNPTWVGHDFHGWFNETGGLGTKVINESGLLEKGAYGYTDANGMWINTTIADNTSIWLYANWTANITQIKLNKNGDDLNTTASNPTLVNATYNVSKVDPENMIKNPTKKGYTFLGWYNKPSDDGVMVMYNNTTPIDFVPNVAGYTNESGYWTYPGNNMSNITMYAHWLANVTVLNLTKNNETQTNASIPGSVNVTYDSSVVDPSSIIQANKTGYILLGWYNQSVDGVMVLDNATHPSLIKNVANYTDGAGNWINATPYGEEVKLYAHWTPITYTVKFDANGGQGSMADMHFTYDQEQNLTANAFQRYNSNFIYWIANNTGIRYNNTEFVRNLTTDRDGIVIMTAQWQGYSTGSNNEATILNNTTVKKTTYTSSSSSSTYTPSSQSSFVPSTQTQTSTPAVTSVATPVATQAPVAIPTAPTTAATTKPTQKSPAPVVGLIAGLGAAALFLRLRK